VRLLKPGQLPAKSDEWTEPLIVRVKDDGAGREPNLFVNSKQIAGDDLDRALKQELAPRKDWIVYVGGDDTIAYQYIATVIDGARSRGARVILFHDPHEQPSELPHKTRLPRR
jgi:biopolymer transport protein ExbD